MARVLSANPELLDRNRGEREVNQGGDLPSRLKTLKRKFPTSCAFAWALTAAGPHRSNGLSTSFPGS